MIFLFSFSIFSNYLKLFEKVICCDLTCRILPSYQHAMNIENPFEAQSNLISSYCFFFIFIMILTTIILLLHFHWLYQEILHFSKQSSLLIPTPTIKLRKHFLGKYHDWYCSTCFNMILYYCFQWILGVIIFHYFLDKESIVETFWKTGKLELSYINPSVRYGNLMYGTVIVCTFF